MKTISIIVIVTFFAANAIAGTLLLTGIGLPTVSSGPPPVCSNSLDFSDQCNSQYIPAILQ